MGTANIPKAKIRVALYSSGSTFKSRPLRSLENTSRFVLSFAEEEKKLPDYGDATGGTDASSKRLSDVTGAMDARHFTPENLALALWGSTASLDTTAIVGESGFKIVPHMLLPTDRILDTSVAPVVKKGATVVSATDYTYSSAGVLINSTITTATVVSGDAVTIDYTPKASHDIQALISSAPDISILVEGVNEVDGKFTTIKIWKAKLGVSQDLGFISEDFETLAMPITIQKDLTVSSSGGTKSQFFYMETQD